MYMGGMNQQRDYARRRNNQDIRDTQIPRSKQTNKQTHMITRYKQYS